MVSFLESGNLQSLGLEPKGSAGDPVTHNSEWKSSTALDIPLGLHVRVGYPDACRCGSCHPIYQARTAMK